MVASGVSAEGGRSPEQGLSCVVFLPFLPWRVAVHLHALHSCKHAPHRARARFLEVLQVLHHMDGALAGGPALRGVPLKRLSQPWQVQLLPCESHGFAWESSPWMSNVSGAAWGPVRPGVSWELRVGRLHHSPRVRWRALLLVPWWMPSVQMQ